MSACRACGHNGPTRGIDDGRFILSVCSSCGFGMGLTASYTDESGSLTGQLNVPSGPHTTAYELSPTGPHHTVEPAVEEEALPQEEPMVIQGGPILLSTANSELEQTVRAWGDENSQYAVHTASDGTEMVTHVLNNIRSNQGVLFYIIDGDDPSFPASEMAFAIRALETAFDVSRTPLAILVSNDDGAEETCRRLGDSQFVRKTSDDQADLAQQIVHLIEEPR